MYKAMKEVRPKDRELMKDGFCLLLGDKAGRPLTEDERSRVCRAYDANLDYGVALDLDDLWKIINPKKV